MSKWTHVSGIIRYDTCLLALVNRKPLNFIEEWKSDLPRGTEGPIQIQKLRFGNEVVNFLTIVLSGDLRDFGEPDDIKELKEWLLERLNFCLIRDCIVRVEVESGPTYVYTSLIDDEGNLRIKEIIIENEKENEK